jgi:DNA processing protein
VTRDQAVALSLLEDIPRRGLTDRLAAGDPELLERATLNLDRARTVREHAASQRIGVVAWNDEAFPASLLTIGDCPPALWHRGSLDALRDAPAVAIVGSRAATAVALEAASRMAAELASLGVTVVSGLARGVDSAAHRGALECGRTIAILGSGVDRIYPAEHRRLAAEIAGAGAVVSEYPPDTEPLAFHFPMRNRLISGLSIAVVVIEAAEDSGSLITAACALEQGREVMAVPGNVLTGRNRGGHALIRDGATIVECAADVVEALGLVAAPVKPAVTSAGESRGSTDPVLDRMAAGEPYDVDALAGLTGLDAARLLPQLAELELRGVVRRIPGGRFVRRSRPC